MQSRPARLVSHPWLGYCTYVVRYVGSFWRQEGIGGISRLAWKIPNSKTLVSMRMGFSIASRMGGTLICQCLVSRGLSCCPSNVSYIHANVSGPSCIYRREFHQPLPSTCASREHNARLTAGSISLSLSRLLRCFCCHLTGLTYRRRELS